MKTLIWFLISFILVFCAIYLVGCFITWDYNPLNWWVIRTTLGRIIFIFMLIYIIPSCIAMSFELKDYYD